jgi:carboxyl-terminal processing protease
MKQHTFAQRTHHSRTSPLSRFLRDGMVGCIFLALFFSCTATASQAEDPLTVEHMEELLDLIEQTHFSHVPKSSLIEGAIEGMLQKLNDPYTQYYNAKAWDEFNRSLERKTIGIGISYKETEKGLYILKVYPGSAAEKAGIVAHQTITHIDGIPLSNKKARERLEKLKDEEGKIVAVELRTATDDSPRTVSVTVASYTIPSVEAVRTLGDIGYVKVVSFAKDTAETVTQTMEQLGKPSTVKGWIIDLRDNPGGYVDTARKMASLFIPAGRVLYTLDRNGFRQSIDIPEGQTVRQPVVVLINEYSASASEVFAGALQDYNKAVLIGKKTFGKGTVQQLYTLKSGGIKVTVSHYLTPLGKAVNQVGISPDQPVEHPLRQTIRALSHLGTTAFRLESTAYESKLNGIDISQPLAWKTEKQNTLVAAKDLVALIDGQVLWDAYASQVIVTQGVKTRKFGATSGLSLRDGVAYLSSYAWMDAFPQVKITTDGARITLERRST